MESATCERGFSIRTLTKTAQRYSLGDSLLAAVMMIDMNGPDFEAVNEVKELILEFLKVGMNYKKWNARGSTAGVTRGSRSVRGTSNLLFGLLLLCVVIVNFLSHREESGLHRTIIFLDLHSMLQTAS